MSSDTCKLIEERLSTQMERTIGGVDSDGNPTESKPALTERVTQNVREKFEKSFEIPSDKLRPSSDATSESKPAEPEKMSSDASQ